MKKKWLNVTTYYNNVTKENMKEHNPNWSEISDHPYRILIAGGSGSAKTNALLNLIYQGA